MPLMITGISVIDGGQPVADLPKLPDGIHLRWGFASGRGFPAYGFHLYRRRSTRERQVPLTLAPGLRKVASEAGGSSLSVPVGAEQVVLIEASDAQAEVEMVPWEDGAVAGLVLPKTGRLTFHLPVPVYRVEVDVVLRDGAEARLVARVGQREVARRVADRTGTHVLSWSDIAGLDVSGGPGAIVELRMYAMVSGAQMGWEPVPGAPAPILLPLRHPDYAGSQLSGGSAEERLERARQIAADRVRYGDPARLTKAGPAQGGVGGATTAHGSPIVLGQQTDWRREMEGRLLHVQGDDTAYLILQVLDAGRLLLSRPYAGPSGSGRAYELLHDGFGELHDHLAQLVRGGPARGGMSGRTLPGEVDSAGGVRRTFGSPVVNGTGTQWIPELQGLDLRIAHPLTNPIRMQAGTDRVEVLNTVWPAHLRGGWLRLGAQHAFYRIEAMGMGPDGRQRLRLNRRYAGPPPQGFGPSEVFTTVDFQVFERRPYRILQVQSPTRLLFDGVSWRPTDPAPLDFVILGRVADARDDGPAELAGGTDSGARQSFQYPLDLISLAATDPAMAQILGLYWIDEAVQPGDVFDYLVIADHKGHIKPKRPPPPDLEPGDYAIVLDLEHGRDDSLHPPPQPEAFVLPGTTVRREDGTLLDARNNVGVRWTDALDPGTGGLLAGEPIQYHLWRHDHPAEPQSGVEPDPKAFRLRTLLFGEPVGDLGGPPLLPVLVSRENPDDDGAPATPQRPEHWPPFPLRMIDRALEDGWYSYRMSGVDLFGRHTPLSPPARWMIWKEGLHKYPHPAAEVAVHAENRLPPPPPTGLRAQLLDPADPHVIADAAYHAWRSTPGNEDLIGVRVSWRWPQRRQDQAPDAQTFRVEFGPGAGGGAGSWPATPANWNGGVAEVAVSDPTDSAPDPEGGTVRRYETFLPAPAALPQPTLQDPVVYGRIGVRTIGATGLPGPVTPGATIARVHRTPPAAPGTAAEDSDVLLATPADARGHSYYTFRWPRQPQGVLANVYRALGSSLFRADRQLRMQGPAPLSADDSDRFPPELRGGGAQSLRRQEIADELDALDGLVGPSATTGEVAAAYRALSNDALRVLAGLPGREVAFTALNHKPLDPHAPALQNRPGPDDDPADYPDDPGLCAYVDTIEGRSRSLHFYRAGSVDRAGNRSEGWSFPTPPVTTPDIVPPAPPVLTRVFAGHPDPDVAGDLMITLEWACGREDDLQEYRVFRTSEPERARDVRLMDPLPDAIPPGPATQTSIVWTDQGLEPFVTYHYRLVALDTSGNASKPSEPAAARTYDDRRPAPPTWGPPVPEADPPGIRLAWTAPVPDLRCMVQRRGPDPQAPWRPLGGWLPPGEYEFLDVTRATGSEFDYRLIVVDSDGRQNRDFLTLRT